MYYYFISDNPELTTLYPRVPNSAIEVYEDVHTERVCLATSIEGCLSAIHPVLTREYKSVDWIHYYYVYIVVNNFDLYTPNPHDVYDCTLTGEVWSLSPVELSLIGCIVVTDQEILGGKYIPELNRDVVSIEYKYEWIENNIGDNSIAS